MKEIEFDKLRLKNKKLDIWNHAVIQLKNLDEIEVFFNINDENVKFDDINALKKLLTDQNKSERYRKYKINPFKKGKSKLYNDGTLSC